MQIIFSAIARARFIFELWAYEVSDCIFGTIYFMDASFLKAYINVAYFFRQRADIFCLM